MKALPNCRLRTLIATLVLLAGIAGPACAQSSDAARAKVLLLMEQTGMAQIVNQLNAQMLREMGPLLEGALKQDFAAEGKAMSPDLFAIAMEEMQASINESMPTLLALIADEYAAFFTEDEIDQMIAFYESPLGQKVIKTQPQLMRRSIALGQSWGREAGTEAMTRAMARIRAEAAR